MVSVYDKRHVTFAVRRNENTESSTPYPFGGLRNVGNNCFANSLLQCLQFSGIKDILKHHSACDAPCFVCSLRDFFSNIQLTSEDVCSRMQDIWKDYKLGTQQDCLEMYQMVLQALDRCSEFTSYRNHFFGTQNYTVTCSRCGTETINSETFNSLSLSLTNTLTIHQAVDNFFSSQSVKSYKCKGCKRTGDAKIKHCLVSIPKNVAFHLKRFSNTGNKDSRELKIIEELHLRPYVCANKKELLEDKADLYGAIMHRGTKIHRGHFFAIVRHRMQWYKVDDMRITRMTREVALKEMEDSYILFYRTRPRPYIN